jgi:CDP-glycerol glycerophosphotransferase
MADLSGRVSVIVPVYNVAAYLETCLESLAQQSMPDLEVVMVEDGSTDASTEIAERFVARDPRFKLVRQANAGLGAARNTGVVHATGEFVAFVDSDDVVPRHAYELLVGALDRTRSDFATGNFRRLTPFGTTKVGFVARAFERSRLETHITRLPALVADRTAWNKLFRRSFWDEHGFRFPVGVYYEDTPVTLPAHYLATSVDVISEPVYLWRTREGSDLSITQRRTEPKALRDRVAAVDSVSRFLAARRYRVSKAIYDRSVVGQDLRFFLDVLPSAEEEYRRLFLEIVNGFIDQAHPWCLEQPLAIDRVKWQLVRRRALPELLETLRFEDEELVTKPPVHGRGGRWYGDYPYRDDRHLGLPAAAYRLNEELAPVFQVDDIRWEGDVLRLEGYAYINMIGAPERDSQRLEVFARERRWPRRKVRLETSQVHRPDVTTAAAQEFASLDWSGFVATLDTNRLRRGGRWPEKTWEIGVRIRAGGVTRTSTKSDVPSLRSAPEALLTVPDGPRVRAGVGFGGLVSLDVERRPAAVRSAVIDDGVLQLEGDLGGSRRRPTLQVSRRGGAWTLDYPVHVDRSGERPTFLARLPLAELLGEVDVADVAAHVEEQADGVIWDLFLSNERLPRPLLLHETVDASVWSVKGREIALGRGRIGNMTLTERSPRPVVSTAERAPEGSLHLAGAFRAPAGDYDLLLSARLRSDTYTVPLRFDAERERFEAEVPPAALSSVAGVHPLSEGLWRILVLKRGEPRDSAVNVLLGSELLDTMPLETDVGPKRFRFGLAETDSACIAVERDLDDEERGGFRQRRLRTGAYVASRSKPLLDVVVYDCFGGRGYGDSPRAVHEELVRRRASLEHRWIVRDAALEVPETAVALRHGSSEYYDLLARARFVVSNDHWPSWLERREGQTCLQTWHGAPLKRQGYDLAGTPQAFRAYRRVLSQKAANWDCVLSAAPFATPVLRRAFPAHGKVLETGLPRSDRLFHPEREAIAAAVKERLGVTGKRVVLYEPTYRDHLEYRSGVRFTQLRNQPTYRTMPKDGDRYRLGQLLDIPALQKALGEEQVLLFRRHRRVADALPAEAEPFALDVSDYPDELDLLLAADVLVTDYSSALFDFAATGRPIVFFVPDLEDYRDKVRGFNIDFEAEAPGPLLRATDEVIEALRDPEGMRAAHEDRYRAFTVKYCSLMDGGASGRVAEQVFGA